MCDIAGFVKERSQLSRIYNGPDLCADTGAQQALLCVHRGYAEPDVRNILVRGKILVSQNDFHWGTSWLGNRYDAVLFPPLWYVPLFLEKPRGLVKS